MSPKKNNKNTTVYLLSYLGALSLLLLFIYLLFLRSYFSDVFVTGTPNQDLNINSQVNLELNYDPLITVVPEELQSSDGQSKFFISNLDPKQGSDQAKAILILWSRFDNESAKAASLLLEDLKQEYNDDLIIIWKDLIDPDSDDVGFEAAMAGHCANEQQYFWDYHDKIFANTENINTDNLKIWAEEIGIDSLTFNQCLDQKDMQAIVANNYYAAQSQGITEAPTIFINSEKVSDATNIDSIKEVINKKLENYEN